MDTQTFKPVNPPVYPSSEQTVFVHEEPTYGGAHLYHITNCMGFENGETQYVLSEFDVQSIQFVHKADDGTITPGLQSEQLVIMLLDRHIKLDERFPSPQNKQMISCLQGFLDACQARIDDRINRGVMGKLKR